MSHRAGLISKPPQKGELSLSLLPRDGYIWLSGTDTTYIHEGVPGHSLHLTIVGMIENGDMRHYNERVCISGSHWLKISLWDYEQVKNENEYGYVYHSVAHGWVKYDDSSDRFPLYNLYH